MQEELKIEVGGIYKTHVGDLVKIISVDKPNDRIHIFNISDGANQHVSLSGAIKFKLKARVK